VIHRRTHPACVTEAGKCYYYDCCKFETNNSELLKAHLRDNMAEHMEYLTLKLSDVEKFSKRNEEGVRAL